MIARENKSAEISDKQISTPLPGDVNAVSARQALFRDAEKSSTFTTPAAKKGTDKPVPLPAITLVDNNSSEPQTDRRLGGKDKIKSESDTIHGLTAEQQQEQQREIMQLQRLLNYYLPQFVDAPGQDGRASSETIEEERKKLKAEDGRFGEDTKRLYAKYLHYIEDENAPALLRLLELKGLPLPYGAPIFLSDTHGSGPLPAMDRRTADIPDLRGELQIDPTQAPSRAVLDRLYATLDWMGRSKQMVRAADTNLIDKRMIRELDSLGFSDAWMPKADTERDLWRENVAKVLDMAHEMRRYAAAVQALSSAGYNGNLPLKLPPGVTRRTDGTLSFADPKDPRADSLENTAQLKAFEKWRQQYGQSIDEALLAVELARLKPDQMLTWGDVELRHTQAVFLNGKFDRLVKAGSYPKEGEPLKPGETLQDVNLIQNRFSVRTIMDTDGHEKIVVDQNIQAAHVAVWGYQNLVGVSSVGAPYQHKQIYNSDDFVPINTPDGMKLIQARDLEQYKLTQELSLYGGKALVATMDGAMLASGSLELKAVVEGALALSAGAELAGGIGVDALVSQGLKTGLRLTVAGARLFNNAGADDTKWGRLVNDLTGAYFLGDVGLGVLDQPDFISKSLPKFLNGSENMGRFLQSQSTDNAWVAAAHTGTTWAFKAAEIGSIPQIVESNVEAMELILAKPEKNSLLESWRDLPQEHDFVAVKPGEGDRDITKQGVLAGTIEVLSSYESELASHATGAEGTEVRDTFDETITALRNEQSGNAAAIVAKHGLIEKLIRKEQFSPSEIKQMNEYLFYHRRGGESLPHLTEADLTQLYGGRLPESIDSKRGEHLKEMSEKFLAARDQNVEAARRIALLYLARDKDGNLTTSLGGASETAWIFSYSFQQRVRIKTDDLISKLRSQLEHPHRESRAGGDVDNNRGLSIGEVLTHIGAISNLEYASVLQDILTSHYASKEDKMQALINSQGLDFATLVASAQAQERASSAPQHYGLQSIDLLKTLEQLASNGDEDMAVRATAAVLTFGLQPENISALPTLVDVLRDRFGKFPNSHSATFASETIALLKRGALSAETTNSENDAGRLRQLDAAKTLRMLGDSKHPDLVEAAVKGLAQVAVAASSKEELKLEAYSELFKARTSEDGKPDSHDFDVLKATSPALAENVLNSYLQASEFAIEDALSGGPENKQTTARLLDLSALVADRLSESQRGELASFTRDVYTRLAFSVSGADVKLKSAALIAMCNLDPKGSVAILRLAADSQPSQYAQSEETGGEQSASVRMTALSLLNKLHDSYLVELLPAIEKTETDSAVAKQIQDLKCIYNRQSQSIETQAQEPVSLPLADIQTWLNDHDFSLLNNNNFQESVQKATDDSMGRFQLIFSSEKAIEEAGLKAVQEITAERHRQWEQLLKIAMMPEKRDPESLAKSNQAKAIIYSILRGQGRPVATPGTGTITWRGHEMLSDQTSHWEVAAAKALASASAPGVVSRDIVEGYIKEVLTNDDYIAPEARTLLLHAWQRYYDPMTQLDLAGRDTENSSGSSFVPYSEYVQVIKAALIAEQVRISRGQGSTAYYQELRTAVDKLPNDL